MTKSNCKNHNAVIDGDSSDDENKRSVHTRDNAYISITLIQVPFSIQIMLNIPKKFLVVLLKTLESTNHVSI